MSFPPNFLEELRARLPLVERVARKVKLIRKGREYSGLCPFHSEKSPSFTVSEDKGFFHCFGCGAHGDLIGFVMQSENLSFLDTIEKLAAEAGLEVPRASPVEQQRIERAKTLYGVLEGATQYYQAQLAGRGGETARQYLQERGIGPAAATRFRLGFAPAETGLLKRHLGREFSPALLEEAGLTRTPEDGRETFEYFRGRVMFPILDRRGRVIAFGGRVLGDGKPKYLNSPETPLFHKGRQVYGLAWARDGVSKGAELLVTEGYMDVIALHLAGFDGAVAPLGTALTEDQMEELWHLAAEPVLCFDGDAAGQRAADRALDRALPLVKSGRSLRFAALPQDEDPDSLVRKFGRDAMQDVINNAKPLGEFLWSRQLALRPIDTPERRAELETRLTAIVERISDAGLRREYLRFFRSCMFERQRGSTMRGPSVRGSSQRNSNQRRFRTGNAPSARFPNGLRFAQAAERLPGLPAQPGGNLLDRRLEEVLVRLILDYPELLDDGIEEFAALRLAAPDLDRLRDEIINLHARIAALDAATLKQHLSSHGRAAEVEQLLAPNVSDHLKFAVRQSGPDAARRVWQEALLLWRRKRERALELDTAVRRFEEHPSEEAWFHVQALPAQSEQELQDQSESEP